jgi:glycosyltransferase involved in cell wall biosynthesis
MSEHHPFVSILTPTFNRRLFIPQYLKYIRSQNYKGPIEVIIADDGDIPIGDLVEKDTIIRYIRLNERKPLGYKRNLVAAEARGDILINMDDDDYYPPSRIKHAVSALLASQKMIAGSSQCFFYDTSNQLITVSGPFGPNHATAGSMAFFKEYIKNHAFSNEALAQEEPQFTNNFTEPMVQLDPMLTMLVIQHQKNTWDKSQSSTKEINMKPQDFIKSIDDRRFYKKLFALNNEIR